MFLEVETEALKDDSLSEKMSDIPMARLPNGDINRDFTMDRQLPMDTASRVN